MIPRFGASVRARLLWPEFTRRTYRLGLHAPLTQSIGDTNVEVNRDSGRRSGDRSGPRFGQFLAEACRKGIELLWEPVQFVLRL